MVHTPPVLDVVLDLHIFVQLFLGVQSLVHAFPVDLLEVVASDSSGTFVSPLFDFAGVSDGCIWAVVH